MYYSISKSFDTKVKRSPRVLEVAEAFGLGLEEKHFTIYDNLELYINQGDIVYITGSSGSGKSQLLKILYEQMSPLKPTNIDSVSFEDKPLIDQIGNDTNEAIRILSAAGLNDAHLFIRSPNQLSDGQLYRFRIAKLIESGSKAWFADEFGAVLDRTTAKLVAFNLRKQAQRAKATVVVATTHKDLREELAPHLYIDKRYGDAIEVNYDEEFERTQQ